MSLKAKIEAVIYASEEPVTLAQLIGLLGEQARLELDHLAAQQQSLALEDEADEDDAAAPREPVEDADALNAEILNTPGPESTAPGDPQPDPKLAKDNARRLREHFRLLLDSLIADYANPTRGLEIREVANGFRLATKPEYHDAVRGFIKSLKPPLKLTLQALETLAVVAYKQPVTAPEISEIRGVDSAGVLGSLLTRKLITTAGRKQVIGRPILYKTTKDFLLRFGLKDIAELPSIEEFEKMAGELNETLLDQVQETEEPEEIPMNNPPTPPDDPTPHDPTSDHVNPNPGGSPPIAELTAPPRPSHIHHDTAEDLMSDHSTHPEGHKHEPLHPSPADDMPPEDGVLSS
jgi:segregation and condensation protein B